MNRLLPFVAALLVGGCSAGFGGPSPIDMPIAALAVDQGTAPAAVAATLDAANVRAAFIAVPSDDAWFADLAAASGLTLSGPAPMDGMRMGFLGPEPVGDTTLTLEYEGGTFTIQDALYEIEDERLLDLLAFRIEDGTDTRAIIRSLLEYVATDVGNAAALVMAASVPSAAVGDSVARMLGPAYDDALRCESGAAASSEREEIRLFFGPAARMYCVDAEVTETAVGDLVRAELIMGRR